jgi:hypothetical protein
VNVRLRVKLTSFDSGEYDRGHGVFKYTLLLMSFLFDLATGSQVKETYLPYMDWEGPLQASALGGTSQTEQVAVIAVEAVAMVQPLLVNRVQLEVCRSYVRQASNKHGSSVWSANRLSHLMLGTDCQNGARHQSSMSNKHRVYLSR